MTTEGNRRSKLSRHLPGAFSAIASFLILVYLWQPIDDSAWLQPTWHAGVIALAFIALFGTFLVMGVLDWEGTWQKVVSALVVPVLCVAGWAVYQRPDHQVLREAKGVWNRYTHRFPEGRLGEAWITERSNHDALTVCAKEEADHFCLEMFLGHPPGREVAGGFRTRYIEEYEGVTA